MNISTTRLPQGALARPQAGVQTSAPVASETVAPQGDTFAFSQDQESQGGNIIRSVFGAAAGAGIGAMAGLHSGTMAGFAGAAVTALPAAFAGGISGALLAERFGQSDSEAIVGAGLWGAVIGGGVGALGGGLIGSQVAGTGAAIGLGLVGAVSGLMAVGQ